MASKRRLRCKSCGDKQKFDTAQAAQAVVWHVKHNASDRRWLNVYRCQFCKKYHFGHAPGSSRLPG